MVFPLICRSLTRIPSRLLLRPLSTPASRKPIKLPNVMSKRNLAKGHSSDSSNSHDGISPPGQSLPWSTHKPLLFSIKFFLVLYLPFVSTYLVVLFQLYKSS